MGISKNLLPMLSKQDYHNSEALKLSETLLYPKTFITKLSVRKIAPQHRIGIFRASLVCLFTVACLLFGQSGFGLPTTTLVAEELWAVQNQTAAEENQGQKPTAETQYQKEKKQLLFYWHINARYINDYQNGNLVMDMDDRFTYGISTLLSLNNWDLFFDHRSLTDQYESITRIDEMQIGLRYTLGNFLSQRFWLNRSSHYDRRAEGSYNRAYPFYLGAIFNASYFQAGNLQGQALQNGLHQLSRMPKVFNDYLQSFYTASLGLELYFAYSFPLSNLFPTWETALWQNGVNASAETAFGYQENMRVGLRTKWYSINQYLQFDFYLQQLGYYKVFGQSNTVEKIWSDTKTAFWLAFSSRTGFYQRRVDMSFGSLSNPEGQNRYPFGFGSLEFSWASLQKKKTFVEADYSQSLLLGICKPLVIDRFSFFFRLAGRIPSAISFLAVRSRLGDPRLFSGDILARKAEAAWLGMLDLRPTLELNKVGFLEFYAGVGAGLLTIESFKSIEQLSERQSFQFFSLAGQAGMRWYGMALRRDGAVYGIDTGLLMIFPFNNTKSSNLRLPLTGMRINNLQPQLHFFLGISILADW